MRTTLLSVAITLLYSTVSCAQGAPQAAATPSSSTVQPQRKSWIELLIENPIILTTLATGLCLPTVILFLNNRQALKIKRLENELALSKIETEKKTQSKYEVDQQRRQHQNVVLSSLTKLLFEVQRLHIELSSKCDSQGCIDGALSKFNEAFGTYQATISDNQIYLSPDQINNIYGFYSSLSELLIMLNDIKDGGHYELAIVPVHQTAKRLADDIISTHKTMLEERNELTDKFDRAKFEKMRNCCGRSPSPQLVARFESLRRAVRDLPDEPEQLIAPAQSHDQSVEERPLV